MHTCRLQAAGGSHPLPFTRTTSNLNSVQTIFSPPVHRTGPAEKSLSPKYEQSNKRPQGNPTDVVQSPAPLVLRQAFAPACCSSPPRGRPAGGMAFRASLSSTPAFRGRNRKAMSTRRLGFREGEGGMNEGGHNAGAVGGKEGGGEGEAVAARRARFARPAAVLRFVRQAVERGVSKSR